MVDGLLRLHTDPRLQVAQGFSAAIKAGWRTENAAVRCPADKTVLANEQVIAGHCERCGTAVEQRMLAQWFFRISDYAERLLRNLDSMDWSESTKTTQRNWIGRSEGAEITFRVLDPFEQAGSSTVTVTRRCARSPT